MPLKYTVNEAAEIICPINLGKYSSLEPALSFWGLHVHIGHNSHCYRERTEKNVSKNLTKYINFIQNIIIDQLLQYISKKVRPSNYWSNRKKKNTNWNAETYLSHRVFLWTHNAKQWIGRDWTWCIRRTFTCFHTLPI